MLWRSWVTVFCSARRSAPFSRSAGCQSLEHLEAAADSLLRASLTLRDYILGEVMFDRPSGASCG
jgi:hypothetical protein